MRKLVGVILGVFMVGVSAPFATVSAASAYASPAFQTQWNAGEAVAPNFWGPLSLARDGQQEPYRNAPGGQRLVQYFDKARMEQATPGGPITNGLLAKELVTGRIQLGDDAFQSVAPASIPLAGDPDGGAPTYASLATTAAQIIAPTANTIGTVVHAVIVNGQIVVPPLPQVPGDRSLITDQTFDASTQHNVMGAFADYRSRVGLGTIGLAISEPFIAEFNVAGMKRQGAIQVFERRVLTFTPSNPPLSQVEMGNVGQHYYQWRYGTGGAPAATNAPIAVSASITDASGLFRIGVPNGWSRQGDMETAGHPLVLAGPNFTAVYFSVTPAGAGLDAGTTVARDTILKQPKTTGSLGATADVHIGGESAKTFAFTQADGPQTFYGNVWVTLHAGKFLIINSLSLNPDASDLNAVIASIQFTDSSDLTAPVAPQPPPATTLAVTFASLSSPIGAGNVATASIKTSPGASCSIVVTYKSGRSTAKGLDPKVADASGAASWSWLVGGNTTPGTWPVDVACSVGGQSATQRSSLVVT